MAVTAGGIASVLVAVLGDWRYAPAAGWDVAELVFCARTWTAIWPMPASETAAHATDEDPSRPVSDVVIVSASVASLTAVGVVLVHAHSLKFPDQVLLAG